MEMVTTFCGQELFPLKWGIFSQNPLKCVRSKTLEIELSERARGFESHRLRQQQSRVNQGFTRVFLCLLAGDFALLKTGKSG